MSVKKYRLKEEEVVEMLKSEWYDSTDDIVIETKDKLAYQLFIGKVSEVIGEDKTIELLRESKEAIASIK